MTRVLVLLPLIVILALAGLFFFRLQSGVDPSLVPSALIGKPAPALTLAGLNGQPGIGPGDLADGRVKIVNFWASWCAPCHVEHPLLAGLATLAPIYGIDQKDQLDDALGFLEEAGNPYQRIAVDPDRRASIEWGVYAVPETFVVDGKGIIVFKHVGPLDAAAIHDEIEPAIARAAAGAPPG